MKSPSSLNTDLKALIHKFTNFFCCFLCPVSLN
ncbi:hypothetical protein E2C01_044596 [Portunus trituberculatus]|uniref:Uncharacterized protein n=1 Tax=Portunus trituberculatus TaxID=210409 RepID=A0A5B7FZN0_PORTR|nr:hypothetical protein [Portunus trituberculatus]